MAASCNAAANLLQDPDTSPVSNYIWDAKGRLTTLAGLRYLRDM